MKRRTASLLSSTSVRSSFPGFGIVSDGVRQITSPRTPTGSRLVMISVSSGHARSSRPATVGAHASTRCSAPSKITSVRAPVSFLTSRLDHAECCLSSRMPQAAATVHVPGEPGRSRHRAQQARRPLGTGRSTPAVRSKCQPRLARPARAGKSDEAATFAAARWSSASWGSRPMNEVSSAGRLFGMITRRVDYLQVRRSEPGDR